MIPKCFSHPDSVSTAAGGGGGGGGFPPHQNLITCIYQTHIFKSPAHLTLTWSKTPFSHSLTIHSSDPSFSATVSLLPTTFSFFRTRPGSKTVYPTHHQYPKSKLYWDFSRAEFTNNSAEPDSRFYVAIMCNKKLEFFLGDLPDEFTRRTGLVVTRELGEPTLLTRREHVFGNKTYVSRAEFLGSKHEIGIEFSGGVLKVKIDGEVRLAIKRISWKFRGNERIYVDGIEIEFFWDIFNWVHNINNNAAKISKKKKIRDTKCDHDRDDHGNGGNGHGVFIFQVGDGGVWPEMVGPEKRLMRKSLSSVGSTSSMPSPSPSCSSVLQWAEESSSDGGRSSCSSSTKSCGSSNGGFSLLLYAWKKD